MKARAFLAKRPKLSKYEESFMGSFVDLSSERQMGMAVGPIPRSAIISYAREERLGETDTIILMRVIRAMDTAYLNAVSKVREAGDGG